MPKPYHPYLVMGISILLPGLGQVLNGQPNRGLAMDTFMVVLGLVTAHFAHPGSGFIASYAGGVFIYAISVMDAYKFARIRQEAWRRQMLSSPSDSVGV
ncbi:MAG: hypothetical protein KGQ58_07265 [Proteobacteria bacterium]|nr:hypothetical protein [Pseudomonadota bacterium]MDE3207656.1 hypothetical protein [Pseudomonadota bacterium]